MVVALLALAGVAIAAAGGDDDNTPAKGSNLTALKCPLEPTGKSSGGYPEYRPAASAFDTAELIGLGLPDARRKAAQKGCAVTVSVKDGTGQPVPVEVDPKLIYVYTEHGVVTQIEGVGGGI
jgi:hypothetical protein